MRLSSTMPVEASTSVASITSLKGRSPQPPWMQHQEHLDGLAVGALELHLAHLAEAEAGRGLAGEGGEALESRAVRGAGMNLRGLGEVLEQEVELPVGARRGSPDASAARHQ